MVAATHSGQARLQVLVGSTWAMTGWPNGLAGRKKLIQSPRQP